MSSASSPLPPRPPVWREIDAPRSLRRTLSIHRHGTGDPTTRLGDGRFVRATLTPDGPGTLLLRWRCDPATNAECGLDAEAWGPGADWLLAGVDRLTGAHDRPVAFADAHPAVERSLRLARHLRVAASGQLYHQLLPTIIGQRITGGEAVRQWARLCYELGEPPPGPPELVATMRLPPAPTALHRRPAWWFHPLGIESARARPLTEVARHADKLWRWTELGVDETAAKLQLLPGVGVWTVGSVLGPVLGDPDAVPVGDYHHPNTVSWALADEPRGDDDRMLELLEPYRGQRGRVLWALTVVAGGAPKFGPRQRILPMARW
ncbi:MAG: DNA-3-methyladenine glycosylase 2 family protein [Ilumatobacter sp.]|nr:DNA-3-methyladenine glycosylase 2 family protein [Ilumatobacter sp.]